ncbi:MAG: RNA methyltransferase [Gammaproteobacteria bacterium]|nr:RNA methyltransferase [Gammaproteobacteria bacterium]
MMERVHLVLVGTTHPGNIGACARAMKAMGITSLRLVSPRQFPSAEVTARAAGADDVLARAQVHETLAAAVADCGLVLATSARERSIPWPRIDAEDAAARIAAAARGGTHAAIVFGRESSGLSNEELELCHGMIRIPTAADFSSLNIASAAQIVCYELHKLSPGEAADVAETKSEPASAAQMDQFYAHLEQCLIGVGFLDPEDPRRLMRRMRRLFNRAQPDINEYNILRGILAAIQAQLRNH